MTRFRKFLVVGALVIATPFLLFAIAAFLLRAGLPKPDDVVFADFSRARADAFSLIERAKREHATQAEPMSIRRPELPPSLCIHSVGYAFAYPDHVSLVMHSNPEFMLGARFWASGAAAPARDKATRYPGVTFFSIDKNAIKAGENRL